LIRARRSFVRERDIKQQQNTATMSTQPPKRTRFADTATSNGTPADTSSKQPPSGPADSFIRGYTASLHPELAAIAERLGKEHIVLLSKRDNKSLQVQRMVDQDDIIPRSARLEFTLNVSKRAKERLEFTALEEETTNLVQSYKLGLKQQIIKASKIEISALDDELRDHLCRSVRVLTTAYMISTQDNGDVDKKVFNLMQHYVASIFINCALNLDTFTTLYQTVHGIETFPPLSAQATIGTMIIPADITIIKDIIEGIFVSSWSDYKRHKEVKQISIDIKKYTTNYLTEKSTAATVAIIDSEPAVDKPELQALIRKETKSESKTLQQQIQKLEQQLKTISSAKNLPRRGQVSASFQKEINQSSSNNRSKASTSQTKTSSKTKKTSSTRSASTNNDKKDHQVDDNINDTASVKKKSKTPNGNASSNSKNNVTKKKKNTTNVRSNVQRN
jgi:hypothetical protein